MNRVKVAKKLVGLAKSLVAVPLPYEEPSNQTLRWARQALMMTLRVDSSWKQVYESFLTFRMGSSNKFHYFGVFSNRSGESAGGNAYGRIGLNPKAIEVARGGQSSVMSAVREKERSKRMKGYETQEV